MALSDTTTQTELIRIGYSPYRENKNARAPYLKFCKMHQTRDACWTMGAFEARAMSEADIGRLIIREGHALSVAACKDGWRKEANFISSQMMGADFDYGPDLDGVRALPFSEYAFLIYRTPSYTPEAPRTRSLYILDKSITDPSQYKKLVKRLLHALSQHVKLDTACKDAARIFYGSKDAGFDYRAGARLPVALLETLPPHPDELAAEREAERRASIPHIRPTGTFAESYGEDFKAERLARMHSAGAGDRHPTLKAIAPPLIARQKGGWPAYTNVDAEIRDAALSAGLPSCEVDSYIGWCQKTVDAQAFEAPVPRLEPIHKPAQPAAEPRRVHGIRRGMEVALNVFGAQGEAVLYRIHRTAEARGGKIESVDDLLEWQHIAGINAGRKTLERYAKNAVSEAGTILTPDFIVDDIGVNFVWRPDSELETILRERAAVYFEVCAFPATEQVRIDPISGEEYVAAPIPAQLKPKALESLGISAQVAQEAADALAEQPFDEKTSRKRWGANKRAAEKYDKFCRLLESPDVIPLSDDIEIRTEGDLKRAQARAWHAAGVADFRSKAEQQFALGIASKNTLKQVLSDAGIACEEDIEYVTVQPGDVGQQVQSMRRNGAWARSYRVIDEDGVITGHGIYHRASVENALATGYTVQVEYQRAHKHHVVDVPERMPRETDEPISRPKKTQPAEPRKPSAPRGQYPREWVTGQLRLHYRLKYRREAQADATPLELIEALTGRTFDRIAADPLLAVALELGARIKRHPLEDSHV